MNTKRGISGLRWFILALTAAALLAVFTPGARAQRDRGANQPGASGNRGGGRDAGVNQPGRAGNNGGYGGGASQTRAAGGAGAAGSAGAGGGAAGDRGKNQPGASGNRR